MSRNLDKNLRFNNFHFRKFSFHIFRVAIRKHVRTVALQKNSAENIHKILITPVGSLIECIKAKFCDFFSEQL